MLSDSEFKDLMDRTRAGDQDAAMKIVTIYEPEIRRAARVKMNDPRLRRVVDSMDICQSVFGKFFKEAVNGSFELEKPEQLLGLLVTMTRNRVFGEHRHQTAQKRRPSKGEMVDSDLCDLVEDGSGPRTEAITNELLADVRSRFTDKELEVADRRMAGSSWEEIASELNESADGLRKRLERAVQRVREGFGRADIEAI